MPNRTSLCSAPLLSFHIYMCVLLSNCTRPNTHYSNSKWPSLFLQSKTLAKKSASLVKQVAKSLLSRMTAGEIPAVVKTVYMSVVLSRNRPVDVGGSQISEGNSTFTLPSADLLFGSKLDSLSTVDTQVGAVIVMRGHTARSRYGVYGNRWANRIFLYNSASHVIRVFYCDLFHDSRVFLQVFLPPLILTIWIAMRSVS